ncbi:MAG: hypothetical protein ACLFT4_09890 [Bacteroidales bacterium]
MVDSGEFKDMSALFVRRILAAKEEQNPCGNLFGNNTYGKEKQWISWLVNMVEALNGYEANWIKPQSRKSLSSLVKSLQSQT